MERKLMPIDIDENDSLVNPIPLPACPGCGMIKNEWPGEGYTHDGETYCCQGCAEGTGCTCVAVGNRASHAGDKNLRGRSHVQASNALERRHRRVN